MAKIISLFKNKCQPTKDIDEIIEEIPIEQAKHWIPESVIPQLQNCLTANKAYELLYINNDYYIIDDLGNYTAYYLGVPGRFI